MKKLAIFFLIIAFEVVVNQKPAHAQSVLENWCMAQGQDWEPLMSTCFVYSTGTVNGSLSVLESEYIFINSTGTVDIYGDMSNDGSIYSDRDGTITLQEGGKITNNGNIHMSIFATILNDGTVNNNGYISSNGDIRNDHQINNNGTLYAAGQWGDIHNDGVISNSGVMSNENFSRIYTSGIINNSGTIQVGSTLLNSGYFYNFGTTIRSGGYISNAGAFFNYCGGTYIGSPPDENPVVYLDNCFYFPFARKSN